MNLKRYYLAYGMNTNKDQMSWRCPNAKSLGKVKLEKHKLVFKHFCDAVKHDYSSMECALWEITSDCEQALDALEGYPTFYGKKEVDVWFNNKKIRAMIYYMTDHYGLGYPSESYFNVVMNGYTDHNMDLNQLDYALQDLDYEYCIRP